MRICVIPGPLSLSACLPKAQRARGLRDNPKRVSLAERRQGAASHWATMPQRRNDGYPIPANRRTGCRKRIVYRGRVAEVRASVIATMAGRRRCHAARVRANHRSTRAACTIDIVHRSLVKLATKKIARAQTGKPSGPSWASLGGRPEGGISVAAYAVRRRSPNSASAWRAAVPCGS
jgi:hypothetical protein